MDHSKQLRLSRDMIVRTIGSIISSIIKQTASIASVLKTKFHTSSAPSISIQDYLKRISKYSYCSESAYIISLIYLDRLQQRNQTLIMNKFCVHRLLITSVMLAVKFFDDFYYKNEYYAKVGGITIAQMNNLEHDYLEMINYDLFVTPQLFEAYCERLSAYIEINNLNV